MGEGTFYDALDDIFRPMSLTQKYDETDLSAFIASSLLYLG